MSSNDSTAVVESAQKENVGQWISDHLQNSSEWHLPGLHVHLPHFEPFQLWGMEIDLSISNHVVMLWLAGFFIFMMFKLTFKPAKKVQSGFGAILETLVVFIRDEIAIANMGEKWGRKFTPLLVSFFFFVLTANLMGLIPLFTTATGNVNVTAGLALITFFATQIYGVKENGLLGYYKGLVPHGVPLFLWPLMFVIELMGLLAKHVALTIRLFANMTAGHIVLFAFLGLIIIFKSYMVAPVSIGFGVFVYFLELLVSFIQAYIFTVLSALFIGMSVEMDH
jgi:F-type H+-transporting ATPase subunit a